MTVPDPRQMYDIDAGFVRDCADGTVFDISICTCDFAPEPFRRGKYLRPLSHSASCMFRNIGKIYRGID